MFCCGMSEKEESALRKLLRKNEMPGMRSDDERGNKMSGECS